MMLAVPRSIRRKLYRPDVGSPGQGPGPGRADPKRRHDQRPSRATADGRPGMGSVWGPILSLEGPAGRGRTWFPGR